MRGNGGRRAPRSRGRIDIQTRRRARLANIHSPARPRSLGRPRAHQLRAPANDNRAPFSFRRALLAFSVSAISAFAVFVLGTALASQTSILALLTSF